MLNKIAPTACLLLAVSILVGGQYFSNAVSQQPPIQNQTGSTSVNNSPFQFPPPSNTNVTSNAQMLLTSRVIVGGVQQLSIIDLADSSLAVYHIDPVDGVITLKSVRRVADDFKMDTFNGAAPMPAEIRAMLNNE